RFMAKATKTKMAQSMQKQLDKIERIEIEDTDTASMIIRFPPPPRSGEIAAKASKMTKKYGNSVILDQVDFTILRGERVAFVGQNGQGKTTLAKILCGLEPASEGEASLGYNVHLGYYAQNQAETLDPKITLIETMEKYAPPEMRTKLRAILGAFLFSGADVDKKVVALSGGERARLAMACMLLRPINLLVLDEPTNHLDMLSKEVLKQALLDFEGTLLVVSHDREFLTDLTNRTIEFRDRKLTEYLGDVNYFLEKRKLDNMRAVEMRTVSSQNAPKVLDAEEKKALQRNIQKFEKRIAELEKEIKSIETNMEQPDFYSSPTADSILKKYDALKSELDQAFGNWEMALEQMGA
ncbi:MAG: ATP-binding cassette domain-containing protein, partial [Bacteroidetes bacterium]|nr:ATP-binding cassette domain-containing protein [Bacteroidota bacterium]